MSISWVGREFKGGRVTLHGEQKIGSSTYKVKVSYKKEVLEAKYGSENVIKKNIKTVIKSIDKDDIERLAESKYTLKTALQEGKKKFKVFKAGKEQDLKKLKKKNPDLFGTIKKVNNAFIINFPRKEEEEEEDIVEIAVSKASEGEPRKDYAPRTCVFKGGKIDRVEDGVEGEAKKGEIQVKIFLGNLLQQDKVDAIVNPANEGLNGGGGLDGKIEDEAGRSIYDECQKQLKKKKKTRGETGEAYITGSGELKKKIKHVIHAIGPKKGTENRKQLLRDAYYNSLMRAHEHQLTSIAFPAISIGVFKYPLAEAAQVALDAVKEFIESNPSTKLKDIRLVYFAGTEKDVKSYNACHAHLDELFSQE